MLPLIPYSTTIAGNQLTASLFAAAAPTVILSDDIFNIFDRYGAGGLFVVAAYFFYKRSEKLNALREAEHKEHIRALKEELVRERTSNRD